MLPRYQRFAPLLWGHVQSCKQQAQLDQPGKLGIQLLNKLQSESDRRLSLYSSPSDFTQFSRLLDAPPKELTYIRGEHVIPPRLDNFAGRLLLQLMGWNSLKSRLIRSSHILYEAVRCQGDNPALQTAFGLDEGKFFSRYCMLMMHVWLLLERLKGQGFELKYFRQRFYENFNLDVQRRLLEEGMEVGGLRWVRKLENMFYAACATFNTAKAEGAPGAFEDALIEHVYNGDTSKTAAALLLARYLEREAECLRMTPLDDVMHGQIKFSAEPFLLFGPPFPPEEDEEAGATSTS